MASQNKGGRLPVSKQFILDTRVKIVMGLLKKNWEKVDIAILFNVHKSAITLIEKKNSGQI